MIRISVRNHSVSSGLFFASFLTLLFQASPGFALKLSYSGNATARLAEHLNGPGDTASERVSAAFDQRAQFGSRWTGAFGFSAWDDEVYDGAPRRYPGEVAAQDSRDLRFRDLFLQYQSSHFFLKVGNQQVVWGEAFGYFYSDIVNPKDLRDGLFGDFADVRLQVPMVNGKIIFNGLTLQGLFLPKAYFNIMPSPGNDYAFPYTHFLPVSAVETHRETTLPTSLSHSEFGGRLSRAWNGYDLSAFFFNYYDRNPYYVLGDVSQLPRKLILEERHARVKSYGLTLTKDFSGYLIRGESLLTTQRTLANVENNSLSNERFDNLIYVLGVDLPTIRQYNIGLQWSEDRLQGAGIGLLRSKNQSLASLRIQRAFFSDQNAELLYTYAVSDRGQRAQFNYVFPLSGKLELRLGIDYLTGPDTSDFGKIKDATRAYVLLKYFLKG